MKKFDLKNWTNTLKILFDDGTEYRLPDISYDKFENSELYKSGSSDIEYDKYLRENGMKELSDFNSESTNEITLIDEQPYRGRVLKFKLVYDSDNDENFNEKEYFGDA
jgi:hypothetical protein|tara:strand:- start:936 stop:1259 length:324 start_codon:yes stop_codon:yes gene_type:complete